MVVELERTAVKFVGTGGTNKRHTDEIANGYLVTYTLLYLLPV